MIRFSPCYFCFALFVFFQFSGMYCYSAVVSPRLERQSEVNRIEGQAGEGRQWSLWLKEGNYELLLDRLEHRQKCRNSMKNMGVADGEKRWFRIVPGAGSSSSQPNYETGEFEVVCHENVEEVSRHHDENGRNLVQLVVDHYQFEPNGFKPEDYVSLTNGEKTEHLPKEFYLLMLLHEEGVPFLNQGNMDQDDNVLFTSIARKYHFLSNFLLSIIQDDLADNEGINELKSKEGDSLGELLLKKFPDEISLVGIVQSFSLTVDLDRILDKERGLAFKMLSFKKKSEL